MKNIIFVGNSYPNTLIWRKCVIMPISDERARQLLRNNVVISVWGHQSSVKAASEYAGIDLTPHTDRPTLILSSDGFPSLDGLVAELVLVLSPVVKPGTPRPDIGQEYSLQDIESWRWLLYDFGDRLL